MRCSGCNSDKGAKFVERTSHYRCRNCNRHICVFCGGGVAMVAQERKKHKGYQGQVWQCMACHRIQPLYKLVCKPTVILPRDDDDHDGGGHDKGRNIGAKDKNTGRRIEHNVIAKGSNNVYVH